MLTTRPLTIDAMWHCMAHLRAADREELEAAGADEQSLIEGALEGWSEEGLWRGRQVFTFGCRPMPGHEIGIPWMLSTEVLSEAERSAVGWLARRVIKRMRSEYPVLTNLVHARNAEMVRFVEALGFTVFKELTGPGYQFRQFIWRRPHV
jgi:hypothetical protein